MAVNEKDIDEAVEVLKKGGIVVYPTETCYGIGCDATNEEAVERVYKAKKRSKEKKLTCIVDSLETAEKYCHLSEIEKEICNKFMPGPLTIVAEKKDSLPDLVNKDFAFRVSSENYCQKLSEKLGKPLIATSANISGNSSSYSTDDISEKLLEKVDFVLDGGELERKKPSTIITIEQRDIVVHREGPVKKKDIHEEIEVDKYG